MTHRPNTVYSLCRQAGIVSVSHRRRESGKWPGSAVHDDHMQRHVTATAPNRVWLTDITEHSTGEGKLYQCAIKDVFSGRIVGYSMNERMRASLAVHALRSAVARRDPRRRLPLGPRLAISVEALRSGTHPHGITGSMGRVASAGDNAAMESFFSLLQKNVLTAGAGPPVRNYAWRS